MEQLSKLTALELGKAIRRGEVSIPQVTALALDRAEGAGDNAFITLTKEQAMARAEELQKGVRAAEWPLYGVPMAYKDNLCTRGVATTCGSRMLADFVPPYSAGAVEAMEGAGAVSIGKTNMDEFAMGSTSETSWFGPVRNPWDGTRSPGGSSGGSAAAVAGGSCWYALGSDTGGSIRQPAAHCGLTGIKPTYGTVSRYGLVAYASSFDQIGPICRDAADCAAVLDVLRRHDPRDSNSLNRAYEPILPGLTGDLRGVTVGVPTFCLDSGMAGTVLAAAEVLRSRGAAVTEIPFPMMDQVVSAYYVIAAAEASSNLSRYDGVRFGLRAEGSATLGELYEKSRSQNFGSEVKRRILLGSFVLSAGHYEDYYKKALAARWMVCRAFDRAFGRCDLMLTPTTPAAAPRLGESLADPLAMYLGDVYTVPANLAGLPALSMPCGWDPEGLPLGCQLIGPRLGEGVLLNAAHSYQKDTDYHKKGAWA